MANLTGNEIFQVTGVLSNGYPSGTSEQVTTSQLAGLQYYNVTLIASGNAYTALSTDVFIAFNSSTASNKALSIPAPTTANKSYIIKDAKGTAGAYNIVITPVSGTVDGQASFTINQNYGSITLVADGISNWMVI